MALTAAILGEPMVNKNYQKVSITPVHCALVDNDKEQSA